MRHPLSRTPALAVLAGAALAATGCGGGSTGLARGPSGQAIQARIAAPPDTVIQRAWETLRADNITPRSFQRAAGDTTNLARMESEWIYLPNVFQSAPTQHLSEPEKYIKLLFWARPFRGGTTLYIEPVYTPAVMPTEPTNWARVRELPAAHPAWQYVDYMVDQLSRRLGE
ncbi:MAG: hypothetical protein RRA92_01565 [Gemmatimonadota bacterium]|nr:hypothetical protein [Gemmatimonadota bacterium]